MRKGKHGVEVSIAMAEAVAQADADCIAAYPITPQTHIVEHLAELVADGELDAEFIPVESEHSAMSVCCGTSAAGARTFTSTSSQGLALMSEIVFITASLRLPVVMALVNRSLSGPLSIWNDHSDVMSIRDCGWIQVFVENGQEAYDHMFWAFKVGEDKKVSLPVIVNLDGFIVSHVIEPIEYVEQDKIVKYLPAFEPVHRLDPDHPVTMGAFAMPELFTETKKAQDEALLASKPAILKGWREWKDLTGREYQPVETYQAQGAKTLILTMGGLSETASVAVDRMRAKGEAVGQVKLRLWRPFPFEEFKAAVKDAETLIVMDRAVSFGYGGPVASELRSVLYSQPKRPKVVNYIIGLAGRDVQPADFIAMVKDAAEKVKQGREDEYEIYGARE
ncbi:MAG TPA: pyruvate ferredoxin oxidoreductase [bacterium]|nr:pyruvate ferredoxin oxidoreductase [bacterium]